MHEDWRSTLFQFRVLYRVFLLRVIDLEILSTDGDPERLMGHFGSILLTISFLVSFPALLIAGGRRLTSRPLPISSEWMVEHFFIETAVTIAGLIAVLSWDASFPDKRDVLILAPLPVRSSTLFLAKISALFAGPALAVIALNLFSGFAWSLVFAMGKGGMEAVFRAVFAYWITIFLGGAFFVFAILAIQGLAENLLPRQIFLRLSALLQAVVLCLLLSVYFVEPSLSSPQALAAPENQRLLAWLPSYWFLGLFHQLDGSMHPALQSLAKRAWLGLAWMLSGAAAALLLSYYRILPKIVEQPEILPGERSGRSLRLGSSVRSAVALFSLRTLLRSRQHRMILSFYLGMGLAIVIGFSKSMLAGKTLGQMHADASLETIVLFASILMMILAVLALRVVVSIPITLRANWVFRTTQIRPASQYQSAIRLSWLLLAVMPVLAVLACLSLPVLSPWRVPAHLVVMALLGATLVELCLSTFRKIPFTCSYLPGKGKLHFVFWVGFFFVASWLRDIAAFEDRLLNDRFGLFLAILSMCVLLMALHRFGGSRVRSENLVFEEEDPAEIVSLKLL